MGAVIRSWKILQQFYNWRGTYRVKLPLLEVPDVDLRGIITAAGQVPIIVPSVAIIVLGSLSMPSFCMPHQVTDCAQCRSVEVLLLASVSAQLLCAAPRHIQPPTCLIHAHTVHDG
jgi:hypothetical protein